tara:strand:- start:3445 stop:3870 length:426 start_codon:yes stop_codon:yes gene_type:complete
MTSYHGIRTGCQPIAALRVEVERDGKTYHLPMRLDLKYHSPSGLKCGFHGLGPLQLSLAILTDFLRDDQKALELYQDFLDEVTSRLPSNTGWQLTDTQVVAAINAINLRNLKAAEDKRVTLIKSVSNTPGSRYDENGNKCY